MTIYIIYGVSCLVIAGFGVFALISKKPVRFWNVQEEITVSDIKKYNRAVACLWFFLAIAMIMLGIPLLAGQNSPLIVISILGTVFVSIIFMVFYTRIEKKYRIK